MASYYSKCKPLVCLSEVFLSPQLMDYLLWDQELHPNCIVLWTYIEGGTGMVWYGLIIFDVFTMVTDKIVSQTALTALPLSGNEVLYNQTLKKHP